jgi:predicted ATPase
VEADLEFMPDADEKPPVVLITGENGTGKSIVLAEYVNRFETLGTKF